MNIALILPAVSLFALATIALLVNPKNSKLVWALMVLLIANFIFAMMMEIKNYRIHENFRYSDKIAYSVMMNENRRLTDYTNSLMHGFGFNRGETTFMDFTNCVDANEFLTELHRTTGRVQHPMTIQYQPGELDTVILNSLLNGYGFHPVISTITDSPNNAMTISGNPPHNEVQIIALSFIRAGVQLRKIVRSPQSGNGKENSVILTYDVNVATSPVISPHQIRFIDF